MPPAAHPTARRVTPLGAAAVLAAVGGWSFSNIVLKITHAPALTFAFFRLWLGAFAMLVTVRVTRRRISWRAIRASAPGGIAFGLNIALFFSALKLTSVADVLVIQALQPALIMMVAGTLFGERVTRWDVWWTVASVGGVFVVTLGSSGTPVWSLRGDLLAVASLVAWTAYFLLSKGIRRSVGTLEYMTTVTLVAALVVTPLPFLAGQSLGVLRWQDWAWLAVFVIAAQGGHVLLAWAHAHVDVSISSLLVLAQPIVGTLAAFAVLGEPLTALEVVGGLVVVASVGAIVRRAATTGRGEPVAEPEVAV